jgi:nucleoside-diphosphate-sugar epimerase
MKQTILVAGGTGNLGERIIRALIARGAEVRATAFDSLGYNFLHDGRFIFPFAKKEICPGLKNDNSGG